MTTLLTGRGRPGELHESRVRTLHSLALLTGHSAHMTALLHSERPDVLRLRPRDGSLFVADAKASETVGNAETFSRLSRYAEFLTTWIDAGGYGVLVLAVPEVDGYDWLAVLRDLGVGPSGGCRVSGHLDPIEAGTAVVWARFAGVRYCGPGDLRNIPAMTPAR